MTIHSFPSYTHTTSPFAAEGLPSDLSEKKVGIIGLGTAGLPLLIEFARKGHRVVGFDLDEDRVKSVNEGESYLEHISANDLSSLLEHRRIEATASFKRITEVDAAIICVPNPLNANGEPDLSYVLKAAEAIAPHMQKGVLIALESTIYPSTTDGELKAALEEGSDMRAGIDFHLAFSTERKDPENPASHFGIVQKHIGGLTPRCLELAVGYYSRVHEVIKHTAKSPTEDN
jgi:UDP-N-acetyl-D-glucosamine dehydrogenase|tara:strand:- start:339 stop:1031 length:693 start_codon:yes stop_codon:yes gene_type:complete